VCAAWAVNSSPSVARAIGRAVSFHSTSTCSRSVADSSETAPTGWPGSAAIRSSSSRKRPAIRSTVTVSNSAES
jgi:hypothetical protein